MSDKDQEETAPLANGDSNDKDVQKASEPATEEEEKRSRSKDKDRKEKKRSRRSRSRDRDRDRDRKDKKQKRDRDRDRDRDRERGRDRDRGRDKDRGRDRDRDRESRGGRERERERERDEPKPIDPEVLAEQERKRLEAAEREQNRNEYTVFVSSIHPKVDERDLFEFFSHVGQVEDIRLIRDQRTQKSKGLCYVEFWERESVGKAIALTGQLLGGYPITVAFIQADLQKPAQTPVSTSMKLYVGSLHQNVTEDDLRPVFEAFGELEFIDLHKDPNSGESKGFGFVQYKHEEEARAALQSLNGLEIAGRAIKVGTVGDDGAGTGSNNMPLGGMSAPETGDIDDGEGRGGVAMTAQGRAALMARLTRGVQMPGIPGMANAVPSAPAPRSNPVIASATGMQMIQATTCVVVKNMFDPATETDANFHIDIKEAVEEESTNMGANIRHIFVDPKSMGHVYIRFLDIPSAEKIVKAFNGRWFASRQISAEFVIEQTYLLRFPEAK
jgi:RNA-binding protein 39